MRIFFNEYLKEIFWENGITTTFSFKGYHINCRDNVHDDEMFYTVCKIVMDARLPFIIELKESDNYIYRFGGICQNVTYHFGVENFILSDEEQERLDYYKLLASV